jgi:hypothetical protein
VKLLKEIWKETRFLWWNGQHPFTIAEHRCEVEHVLLLNSFLEGALYGIVNELEVKVSCF